MEPFALERERDREWERKRERERERAWALHSKCKPTNELHHWLKGYPETPSNDLATIAPLHSLYLHGFVQPGLTKLNLSGTQVICPVECALCQSKVFP